MHFIFLCGIIIPFLNRQKSKLKDKLRGEWFRELGIEGKSKDYFYNKQEFEQYLKIMGNMKKENKTNGIQQKLEGFYVKSFRQDAHI